MDKLSCKVIWLDWCDWKIR